MERSTTSEPFKKKRFVLSRKNQKGQVAIFVALIFQVVFVFFALLINVGLLVHHKINLQQSTDLAAYYGAMKQAEILNAISHVNFQMRQAWKLLTWRYRILGTFGFQQNKDPGENPTFPLKVFDNSSPTEFTDSTSETKCSTSQTSPLDTPFFCVAHQGMQGWIGTGLESNCRISCAQMNQVANTITHVPSTGGFDSGFSGGVSGAVNAAIASANKNLDEKCENLGPTNFQMLAKMIINFGTEVDIKKKLIQMLGADLSLEAEKMLDLEGKNVLTGAQKTFENNLTEANKTGIQSGFKTLNGLRAGSTECPFGGGSSDGEVSRNQFLVEQTYQALQFFVHSCKVNGNQNNFAPTSIFKNADMNDIADELKADANIKGAVLDTIFKRLTIGYEKNPWCVVYYAVKAQTKPKIPFLPISAVTLSAVSVAKPFGGSIGPWFNTKWQSSSPRSGTDDENKTDKTLPTIELSSIGPGLEGLKLAKTLTMNFSNFVGDEKGLADPKYAASYQDILLYRGINADFPPISSNKESPEANPNIGIPQANSWPSFVSWQKASQPTNDDYDYLALNLSGDKNSRLRDLEISVVAPNQFDLSYYSIDPDFYNNYYIKLTGGDVGGLHYDASFDKIKGAVGGSGPSDVKEVRPDFGYNKLLDNNGSGGDIVKNYSVRHQMAVASQIIKKTNPVSQNLPKFDETLKYIADKPSSLLTGWTFKSFSDFDTFPNENLDAKQTMSFGQCNNEWNRTTDTSNSATETYGSPEESQGALPPTPGNCVTGGRTGYSVKLVSPTLFTDAAPAQPYGGEGTSGQPINKIDPSFLSF